MASRGNVLDEQKSVTASTCCVEKEKADKCEACRLSARSVVLIPTSAFYVLLALLAMTLAFEIVQLVLRFI